jgi:hypothetical protein
VLIDISCPSGRISYEASTLEKVYIDKKEKYSKLAQEISIIQDMHVKIMLITVSPRGAVHARSLEAPGNFLLCDDKAMKKIARWPSEAVIAGSIKIWRRYARDMPRTEDVRAI